MLAHLRRSGASHRLAAIAIRQRGGALLHVTARRQDAVPPSATDSAQDDIRAQLRTALKAAMKGKQKEVAGSIKAILADITYAEKSSADPHAPASESHVVEVLRKAIDKRTQATQHYPPDHPNHTSLLSEISLLSGFLPKTLTTLALTKSVTMAIGSLTPEDRASRAATGKVMEKLWEVVSKSEVADKKGLGKMVAELLKKET